MRIILFGASGFVGSAVAAALEVRGVAPTPIRAPRLTFKPGDMELLHERYGSLVNSLATSMAGAQVVVNAARAAAADSVDGPVLDGANGLTVGVLAAAARVAGVPRFVHISSAAVQGGTATLDDSISVTPLSVYARSKALGEEMAWRYGPDETVVYRPAGVHGANRKTTQRLARFARSRFSCVVAPGAQNSPQALVDNVGDAVAFLALTRDTPPACVAHPSEGLTTAGLLHALGQRNPAQLPRLLAAPVLGALRSVQSIPRLSGASRRLELLLVGQHQAPSWLAAVGWIAPSELSAWQALGEELNDNETRGGSGSPPILAIASVPEQIRVQYRQHFALFEMAGAPVHVAAGGPRAEVRSACPESVTTHPIPISRNLSAVDVLRAVKELRRVAKELRPQLAIYGSPAAALVGAIACYPFVKRRIFIVHGLREETLAGRQRIFVVGASWLTSRLSTDTVFASPSARRACTFVPAQRTSAQVATPGFIGVDAKFVPDGEEWAQHRSTQRDRLGIEDSARVLGFVGRLAMDKGIKELVAALDLLHGDHPDLHLILIGAIDDTDPLPIQTLEWINQRPYIHHIGHVEDPSTWYSSMDIFCLPSYREGLPTVLMEAGAAGLPVVATRCTGVTDALKEDEGWLCPVGDEAALADTLSAALRDPWTAQEKARRHRERIEQQYSGAAVRLWWQSFYGDLTKNKSVTQSRARHSC